MAQDALVILIKNPERGKVKTRLAATLGADEALDIYRRLLAHTRRVSRQVGADLLLYYSERIDKNDDWPSPPFHKRRQTTGDIGTRMHHALREALRDHDRAVLIGSDIATLTPEILREAFDALDDHEAVIGPARDGGYYLIGMTRPHPWLFTDMTWSTSSVFDRTVERLDRRPLAYHVLPVLADIDTEADWKTYGRHLREPD